MPFEPRLIAHDDDGRDQFAARARVDVDEFESPDLEVLAAQLSDDADYLARLYPPRANPARSLTRRRRWSPSTNGWWRAAAAVLLLTGAAGALAWLDAANRADFSGGGIALVDPDSVDGRSEAINNTQDLNTAAVGLAPSSDAAQATPGVNENHVPTESEFSGLEPGDLLQDLSVSEQEAVFDLLESEPIELARVSL